MKKYIARKPCRFREKGYIIGEEIPANEIDPSRVKALVKFGLISELEETDSPMPEPKAAKGKKVEK